MLFTGLEPPQCMCVLEPPLLSHSEVVSTLILSYLIFSDSLITSDQARVNTYISWLAYRLQLLHPSWLLAVSLLLLQ